MQRVVKPKCPQCKKTYAGVLPEYFYPHAKLVCCDKCKMQFYVSKQERYIARTGSFAV